VALIVLGGNPGIHLEKERAIFINMHGIARRTLHDASTIAMGLRNQSCESRDHLNVELRYHLREIGQRLNFYM